MFSLPTPKSLFPFGTLVASLPGVRSVRKLQNRCGPVFDCVVWILFYFFDIELHELFLYFGCSLLFHHTIHKYFLPFYRCLFALLIVPLLCKSLVPICFFLLLFLMPSAAEQRKYCCNLYQRVFCLCFLQGVSWFPVLRLSL